MKDKSKELILWFKDISYNDVSLVGGKNASLGEMFRELTPKGVNVPNGFAVSAYAYRFFLQKSNTLDKIKTILKDLDTKNISDLRKRGEKVRSLIVEQTFPSELKEAIEKAYQELEKQYEEGVDVAVRSSATAEDLPDASFAGQQETFLNIKGVDELLDACKKCFASLFTNRAISYRQKKGFDHFKVALSIGVQKMVRSDMAASGVMFTLDTESGFRNVVHINANWGLGENVVQGKVNPDTFYVFKPTLKEGKRPILLKQLGKKQYTMIYSKKKGQTVENIDTPEEKRNQFCLEDDEILELAKYAVIIEDHYSSKNGKLTPMDIEWAKDGKDINKTLYIVQARPETVHSVKDMNYIEEYILKEEGEILCEGASIGLKIASGEASVITDLNEMDKFKKGNILITDNTDPNWEPLMEASSGVITNKGGSTCHAAIIGRELGIPCIVGCEDATEKIKDGTEITIDCKSRGSTGIVWKGKLDFEVIRHNVKDLPKTRTKILMNLANPSVAFSNSFLPADGVGLARMEFIVLNTIKVHPMALCHPEKLSKEELSKIEKLTFSYKSKTDYFIEKLAQGVGMIAAAFFPKMVILRFSDFKTNEYANLIGGHVFEPKEANPMIGWRGASRYYHPDYEEGFALECKAVHKIREEFGLTNLHLMIPFLRTVEEAKKVLETMNKYGLKRGENGLKVMAMCEIPSNCIQAEEFLEILDGFSIGSNDLTQLTLGVDRDSEIIRHIYDEKNASVKWLIERTIHAATRMNKYVGICGQAPSKYKDFAEFLVEAGIESISVMPDSVIPTIYTVAEKENQMGTYH